MVLFVRIMFSRKGGTAHRTWGRWYALAYAVACITSLGIYRTGRFFFPHWLALAGLLVLAIGYLSVRYKFRGWRYFHLIFMLLSAYNLFGGAVNEAFLRVKPLRSLLGQQMFASPLVGIAHGIVGQLFIVLIVVYVANSVITIRRAKKESVKAGLL